jgi:hypothetical protein
MALSPVSRRQVRETLFAFAGLAYESSSDSEVEDAHDEPIIVEALLLVALNGGLRTLPPLIRCIRFPYAVHTRSDQLAAASHLCIEIAQSATFVYLCFCCHKFIIGYICYVHHTRSCLNEELRLVHRGRFFEAPPSWQWVNCDYCIRQEVIAPRHHRLRYVSAVVHWARFLSRLFLRKIRHAPLRCSATLHSYLSAPAGNAESPSPEPLLFFFVALGFPPHLADVLCEFLP